MNLIDLDVPILCETTPFINYDAGLKLWDKASRKKSVIQIAEQYPYHPVCQTWKKIIDDGIIGNVSNMSISMVHSYHAASLIRFFLGTGFQNIKISGKRFFFPVQASDSRKGVILNGEVKPEKRDLVTFEFEDGKVAFFDWGNIQYYSFIRSKRINIQGDRGEIDGLNVHYLNEDTYSIRWYCRT